MEFSRSKCMSSEPVTYLCIAPARWTYTDLDSTGKVFRARVMVRCYWVLFYKDDELKKRLKFECIQVKRSELLGDWVEVPMDDPRYSLIPTEKKSCLKEYLEAELYRIASMDVEGN
jgi:hypothetical protein